MHMHTHPCNGHFPGEPSLADPCLNSKAVLSGPLYPEITLNYNCQIYFDQMQTRRFIITFNGVSNFHLHISMY